MGYFPYHLVSQISEPSTVVIWSHCLMISALPLWNHTEAEAATPPCQPSRSLTLEALVTIFKISPLPTSTSSFFSLSSPNYSKKAQFAGFNATLPSPFFISIICQRIFMTTSWVANSHSQNSPWFSITQSCFRLPTSDYLASHTACDLDHPWAPNLPYQPCRAPLRSFAPKPPQSSQTSYPPHWAEQPHMHQIFSWMPVSLQSPNYGCWAQTSSTNKGVDVSIHFHFM